MIDLFFNIIFFIIVFIVAAIAIMWLFIILKKTIDIIKDEIGEMIEEHKEHKAELLSQEFFENDVINISYNPSNIVQLKKLKQILRL